MTLAAKARKRANERDQRLLGGVFGVGVVSPQHHHGGAPHGWSDDLEQLAQRAWLTGSCGGDQSQPLGLLGAVDGIGVQFGLEGRVRHAGRRAQRRAAPSPYVLSPPIERSKREHPSPRNPAKSRENAAGAPESGIQLTHSR